MTRLASPVALRDRDSECIGDNFAQSPLSLRKVPFFEVRPRLLYTAYAMWVLHQRRRLDFTNHFPVGGASSALDVRLIRSIAALSAFSTDQAALHRFLECHCSGYHGFGIRKKFRARYMPLDARVGKGLIDGYTAFGLGRHRANFFVDNEALIIRKRKSRNSNTCVIATARGNATNNDLVSTINQIFLSSDQGRGEWL